MPSAVSHATTPEQRAMCELIDRLGAGWDPRGPGAGERIAPARAGLVDSGLWGLGLPEAAGGGGADAPTAALAIARVSGHWPALGLGMAHLRAAGVALSGTGPAGDATLCAWARGRPVAVGEVPADRSDGGAEPVRLGRVDVGDPHCDLLLLHAATCSFVPAERARFGPTRERTGLDGSAGVPVTVRAGAAEALAGNRADAVRADLYTGLLAVAAGLTDAAVRYATGYAAGRVQFGNPLTSLPPMRERLAALHGQAVTMLAAVMHAAPAGYAPTEDVTAADAITAADAGAALCTALDAAVDVTGDALGCLGGYGYLEEYPLAGLFRDAISLRAAATPVPVSAR